ncbi:MAG: gamma-glutamyltransferase, partial [Caldimonas sp.]
MNRIFHRPTLAPLVAALLALGACGGGSDAPVVPDTSCQAIASDGTSVVVGSDLPGDPALPEAASGYRTGLKTVYAKKYMVTTSNALASLAGCKVLQKGGTAADAAVAVQAVLGLTVPEATGLGSGGFMLYYDAKAKTVQAYDGRESAPAAATENYLRWIDDLTDQTPPKPSARASGRSIGTIGVPRLIEALQKDHGKLVWRDLFGDAIALSTNGFKIGGRLAAAIASNATSLKRDAEATAYFFNADGTPKALGTVLKNPAYADALTALAQNGADAIYTGTIGQDIIAKIQTTSAADGSPMTPGKTTLADLAAYQAKVRVPVCTTYRNAYWVCGMPPPTSGGITVASALGILENFDLAQYKPTAIDLEGGKPTVMGVHLISEAERLAYADRDKYVADTDFVQLPGNTWNTLLNKPYLQGRSGLISLTVSMGTAVAGNLGPVPLGIDTTVEHGTNQFTIVDGDGSVLTATTTVESSMGSFHMTHGFLLNNQLTDFSSSPTDPSGNLVANRVAPGKRPRSS